MSAQQSVAGPPGVPVVRHDPFAQEFLHDPYPYHEELRETGPVLWLERYGIWGMARNAQVHASLNNWRVFCSSAGVGLSDFRKEEPWRPPSLVLEADPPLHTRTRGVLTSVLSRRALNELRASFQAEAVRLVDAVLERAVIDGIADLAQAFPLRVFPDAVGIPLEGRENLLLYGNMAFNAFGPRNARCLESLERAAPVSAWIMSCCRREVLATGGFGANIFAAVGSGAVSEEEAGLLVRSLLTAGVDTTVHALGNALQCFTAHPDQWQILRSDPGLARSAFEEVIRYESPVQTFFRTTNEPVEVAGTQLGSGEKVLLFLGAANRDPRRWPDPNRFDIRRVATGHVGFGAGIHGCVGQMIARLEGEILLGELARRVRAIEACGEPEPHYNNTLRGWGKLPIRLLPA